MRALKIERGEKTLVIKRRWFSYLYAFFFLLAAVALVFFFRRGFGPSILRGILKLLSDPAVFAEEAARVPFDRISLYVVLTPVFFALLLFEYYGLCTMINTTVLSAVPEGIAVRHGPLPWTRGRRISRGDFSKLIVQTRTERARSSSNTFYRLAALGEKKPLPLTAYGLDPEDLKPIKAELDAFYGLPR